MFEEMLPIHKSAMSKVGDKGCDLQAYGILESLKQT